MRRWRKKNPHKLALDQWLIDLLDRAAEKISQTWRSVLHNVREDQWVSLGLIETGQITRQLKVSADVRITNDRQLRCDGAVQIEDAMEREGELVVPVIVNLAHRRSEEAISDVLYHEFLHLIFWAKTKTDVPHTIDAEAQTNYEKWKKYILTESEFMSRTLTFIHLLERRLAKLWRSDKRRAAIYTLELTEVKPGHELELAAQTIHNNSDLTDVDAARALGIYADDPYYAPRFVQAIQYSIGDRLRRLELGDKP